MFGDMPDDDLFGFKSCLAHLFQKADGKSRAERLDADNIRFRLAQLGNHGSEIFGGGRRNRRIDHLKSVLFQISFKSLNGPLVVQGVHGQGGKGLDPALFLIKGRKSFPLVLRRHQRTDAPIIRFFKQDGVVGTDHLHGNFVLARHGSSRIGDKAGKGPHEERDAGIRRHLFIKLAGIFRLAGIVIHLKADGQLLAVFLDVDAASFIDQTGPLIS